MARWAPWNVQQTKGSASKPPKKPFEIQLTEVEGRETERCKVRKRVRMTEEKDKWQTKTRKTVKYIAEKIEEAIRMRDNS